MQGQPNTKGGSLTDAALEIDPAAMGSNNPLNNHQPQAGTLFLGGVKRLEDPINLSFRNSAPRVSNADPDSVGAFPCLEGEGAALGHGMEGVFDEIYEH